MPSSGATGVVGGAALWALNPAPEPGIRGAP